MRFTYRAAGPIAFAAISILLSGCSRTQQDWRAAQQAGTPHAYEVFAQRHPDSELASIARQRVSQLTEETAWQQATRANTAAAYQGYLAKYPNGSWSQDARIRMESKSLAAQPPQDTGPATPGGSQPVTAPGWPSSAASAPAAQSAQPSAAVGSRTVVAAAGQSNAADHAARARSAAGGRPRIPDGAARGRSAESAAPPSRIASPPANTGRSAVQLGAFSSAANAHTAWRQLSSKFRPELRGLTPRVIPVMSSGRRLYRLEARVASENAARRLCRQLQQHSQGCLPLP